MPRVVLSSQAEADLLAIYSYIGAAERSPEGADRLLQAIEAKCRFYAENPLLGEARPDLNDRLRIFSCGTKANPREWVAVYRALSDGIEVVRVLRACQDFPMLFGRTSE